jgi:hypothetical protein
MSQFGTSLTYDARTVIYDRNMFTIQATDLISVLGRGGWVQTTKSSKNQCQFFDAISGFYNKYVTIVNDDSSIINKLCFKLIDNARVVIYDRNRLIKQAIRFLLRNSLLLRSLPEWGKVWSMVPGVV